MTYQVQNLGTPLSLLVAFDDGQDEAIRTFEYGSDEPTVIAPGLLWQSTNGTELTAAGVPGGISAAFLRWNGSAWEYFAPIGQGPMLAANGSVTVTGNLAMGTKKLTGLGAGSANGDSVRYEQAVLISGANAFAANQSMGGHRLTNLGAPTSGSDAARLDDVQSLEYTGRFFYNTNRDASGYGTDATVKQQLDADQAAGHTKIGFTPREVTFRIAGRFRKQTDNSIAVSGDTVFNTEFTLKRWDAQSAGGDSGTPTSAIYQIYDSVQDVYAVVVWRYTAGEEGFTLRFRSGADTGDWLRLRSAGDASVDGAIHVMAVA